jgi:hypothetical protein
MRIVDSGAFCLRAVVLAILCTLALTGSAYADELGGPVAPPETTEIQGGGGASGEQQSGEIVGGEDPKEGQQTGDGGEEASGGTEMPVEPPPVTEETSGTTVTPAEEAPVAVGPAPQEQPTTVVTVPADEETQQAGASPSHTPIAPDSGATQAVMAHSDGTGESLLQSQALIGGPLTPPPSAPTAAATEAQAPATPASGEGNSHVALTAAQRAGALSCELSALGGSMTDNCTVGWLGAKRVVNSSTVSFGRVAGALGGVTGGGLPPGGGHGGSAIANAPMSPTPGPAPSGASGAAVGGSSGVAPSAFLSLAGLLLLAAPRAMRRLRLSCRPLLTACFVLIPERPG